MTEYATILTERRERVGIITLNRADRLNALNEQTTHDVVAAAEAFDADEGVGAIILTGAGRAFAAGADITEMAGLDRAEAAARDLFAGWDRFAAVRTPTIAAVNGFALGGGCEVAMMCDLIIASEAASFGQPEIGLGVIPGIGGTQRLVRAIGKAKAMDLVLTGRRIDASEAERWGLVSRVVPAESLMDEALTIAAQIAGRSLPALYDATAAIDAAFEGPLAEGVAIERRLFHASFDRADQTEGMAAFVEKREPRFTHR